MTPWKVVAFHTDDELYNGEIAKLKESLGKFGIDYHIKTIDSLGSWRNNTYFIPDFLTECLDMFPSYNLVYLDADAIVREYPVLFNTIEEDIAVHYRHKRVAEMLLGTTYLKNCDKTRELISTWKECMEKRNDRNASQTGLSDAISLTGCSVYKLPAPYTLIFDLMKDQGPPVIEHFQASRRARH